MLNRVCADYRRWQEHVAHPGRVSINLSLKQLRQASFITRFESVFKKHGVSPTCFELEITETTLMADAKRTVKLLDELYCDGPAPVDRRLRHRLLEPLGPAAVPDRHAQDRPVVRARCGVDADDATIVRTIIDMGRSLEMQVVAEGVESEEQLKFLRSRDCHFAQGRLFGDAVSSEEFLATLVAQQAGSSNIVKLFA